MPVETKEVARVPPKTKPVAYQTFKEHVEELKRQLHKGWITKIKFYQDLNYVISSSLDSFIHIHDINGLQYKNGSKTFNLH